MENTVLKETLPNGLTLLMQNIPQTFSASIGILVRAGGINETRENAGISHYLEHMAFKGSANYSAQYIAELVDGLGGRMNAYTSKEYTKYHVSLPADRLAKVIPMLAEMVQRPLLTVEDVELERNVILEEIKMVEDTPEDWVHDLWSETIWPDHVLGQMISGTRESVGKLTRLDLVQYLEKFYKPANMIVAVSGLIDYPQISRQIGQEFGSAGGEKIVPALMNPDLKITRKEVNKKTEQVHLCLGGIGVPYNSDDQYVLSILSSIVGGAMSSRLFQEIREKRGLAYNVYSYPTLYKDTGLFTVYAGCNRDKYEQVVELIKTEFIKLLQDGVTLEELERSREKIRGSIILSHEKTSNQMGWTVKSEYYYGRQVMIAEVLEKLQRITVGQLNALAKRVLNPEQMTLVAVGEFEGK